MKEVYKYFTLKIYVAWWTRQPIKRKVLHGNSFYSCYSSNEAASLTVARRNLSSLRAVLNQHELNVQFFTS